MPRPIAGTYPPYFDNYIKLVDEQDVLEAFNQQQRILNEFFDNISEEKYGYAYAPGKWTLKELLQHVIDTERIFSYRALAISRKETASLPSFDENLYAENSFANNRSWQSLLEELKVVRLSTILLYNSFTTEMLQQSGVASDKPFIVNALGFTTVGHLYHHKNVIESRYL